MEDNPMDSEDLMHGVPSIFQETLNELLCETDFSENFSLGESEIYRQSKHIEDLEENFQQPNSFR